MENTINNRIRIIYKSFNVTLKDFCENVGLAESSTRNMFNRGTKPSFEVIEKIANAYENISMDWLITGEGDMYKHNEAGRDINTVEGENNKQYVQSGTNYGMVGENKGNYLSIGDSSNLKKIMNEEGVSIEFAQSVEQLQQRNEHLEIRVKDLERVNESQAKTIETMQLLIDTLNKK